MTPRNIRSERVRLGLTIDEAVKKLAIARNTLVNWECGKTQPNGSDLARLVSLYGCSADYLLGLTEERLPH